MQIVYEDTDLVIINKPSGLLCVPGLATPDNAFDRLRNTHPNSRIVHRLDMATSGLVIFAQNHPAHRAMGKLFEHRKITKEYTAIVDGRIEASSGEIYSPLICDWENRPRQKIDWLNGKKAHTLFAVTERHTQTNQTRLQLTPITGRSHQLRVHCAQLGHPIVGDTLYNPKFQPYDNDSSIRMLLHATRLTFEHPISHKPMDIFCPPDF